MFSLIRFCLVYGSFLKHSIIRMRRTLYIRCTRYGLPLSVLGVLLYVHHTHAMVWDNRFMPLYPHTYSRTCAKPSAFMGDIFIMAGHHRFDEDDRNEGYWNIFGRFNQGALANAIIELGYSNPFDVPGLDPAQFTDKKIWWLMDGKLQSQGISFQWDQYLGNYISTGASFFFMHLYARNFFTLDPVSIAELAITPEEALKLDQVRLSMNNTIGICAPVWSKYGISDIDWYVRVGRVWDYIYKMCRIDAGLRVGALIPTGVKRNIFNPASVPFGGNGFWGFYVAADLELEVKQDWKVGMLVRLNKRFKKTKYERVPIANEEPLYGATVGQLSVDPGVTFAFSPYFRLEGIQDGLGVQGRYSLVIHDEDDFVDKRQNQTYPATLQGWIRTSDWTAEYLTVDAFYDFAKLRGPGSIAPVFSIRWDIPMRLFLAENAVKTNRLSIGLTFNF